MTTLETMVLSLQQEFYSALQEFKDMVQVPISDHNMTLSQIQLSEQKLNKKIELLTNKSDEFTQNITHLRQEQLKQNNLLQTEIQTGKQQLSQSFQAFTQFKDETQDRIDIQFELNNQNQQDIIQNYIEQQISIFNDKLLQLIDSKDTLKQTLKEVKNIIQNESSQVQTQFTELQTQYKIVQNHQLENTLFQAQIQQKIDSNASKTGDILLSQNQKIQVNELTVHQQFAKLDKIVENAQVLIKENQAKINDQITNQNASLNGFSQAQIEMRRDFQNLNLRFDSVREPVLGLSAKLEELHGRVSVVGDSQSARIASLEAQNLEILGKLQEVLSWQNVNEPQISQFKAQISDIDEMVQLNVNSAFNDVTFFKSSLIGQEFEKFIAKAEEKSAEITGQFSTKIDNFNAFVLQNEQKLKEIQVGQLNGLNSVKSQFVAQLVQNQEHNEAEVKSQIQQQFQFQQIRQQELQNLVSENSKIVEQIQVQTAKMSQKYDLDSQNSEFKGKQILNEYQIKVEEQLRNLSQQMQQVSLDLKDQRATVDDQLSKQVSDINTTKINILNQLHSQAKSLKIDMIDLLEEERAKTSVNKVKMDDQLLFDDFKVQCSSEVIKSLSDIYDNQISVFQDQIEQLSLKQKIYQESTLHEVSTIGQQFIQLRDSYESIISDNNSTKLILQNSQGLIQSEFAKYKAALQACQCQVESVNLHMSKNYSEINRQLISSTRPQIGVDDVVEKDLGNLQQQVSMLYNQFQKFLVPENQHLQPYIDVVEECSRQRKELFKLFDKAQQQSKLQYATYAQEIETSVDESTDAIMKILQQLIKKNMQMVKQILPDMQSQILDKIESSANMTRTENETFYHNIVESHHNQKHEFSQLMIVAKESVSERLVKDTLLDSIYAQLNQLSSKVCYVKQEEFEQIPDSISQIIIENNKQFNTIDNHINKLDTIIQDQISSVKAFKRSVPDIIEKTFTKLIDSKIEHNNIQISTISPLAEKLQQQQSFIDTFQNEISLVLRTSDKSFERITRMFKDAEQQFQLQKQNSLDQQIQFASLVQQYEESHSNYSIQQQIQKFQQSLRSSQTKIDLLGTQFGDFKTYVQTDFTVSVIQNPLATIRADTEHLKRHLVASLLSDAVKSIQQQNAEQLSQTMKYAFDNVVEFNGKLDVLTGHVQDKFQEFGHQFTQVHNNNTLQAIELDQKFEQRVSVVFSQTSSLEHQLSVMKGSCEAKAQTNEKLQFQLKQDALSVFETYSELISRFRADLNTQFESVQNLFNQQLLEQKQLMSNKFQSHMSQLTLKTDANTQLITQYHKSVQNQRDSAEFLLQKFEEFNTENNIKIEQQMDTFMRQSSTLNELQQGELARFRSEIDNNFETVSTEVLKFNEDVRKEVKAINGANLQHFTAIMSGYGSGFSQIMDDFGVMKLQLADQIYDFIRRTEQQREANEQIYAKFKGQISEIGSQVDAIQQTADTAITITGGFRSEISKSSNRLETAISQAIVSLEKEREGLQANYETVSAEQQQLRDGMAELHSEIAAQLKRLFTQQEEPLSLSGDVRRLAFVNFDEFQHVDQAVRREASSLLKELGKRDCAVPGLKIIKLGGFVFEVNLQRVEVELDGANVRLRGSRQPFVEFLYDLLVE
ncbi:hypothetical protein SS50377_26332 [Spironucleus salmonicida]|uniref:Uncharacterized protein n=1 Tax=Spironucleus salmonicida TaxID=348837 RepID=V6M3E1_9EUKA|nr:hypothetical protein SS50377_26332 [Spironucleus salmonicida]|eukprot:EST47799.1 Hypothetical protein SS50377_12200 [Spironucleus salmonicida]